MRRSGTAAALLFFWLLAALAAPAAAGGLLTVKAPDYALTQKVRSVVRESAPALTRLTGAGLGPITVEVVRGREAFARRVRELGGPTWAAGLAVPERGLIVVRSPGQLTDPDEFRPLLIHELTHLHLAAALRRRRPPLWLEEGLAMYASGDGGWGLTGAMSRGVLGDGLIPFSELEHRFPAGADRAALAYAQSYYLISHLISQYGPEVLPRVLAGLRKGYDLTRALREATGKNLSQVEADFEDQMRGRFSWLALLTAAGALWALIALGAGVGLVLRRRAHIKSLRAMQTEADGGPVAPDGPLRRWPPPARPGSPLGRAGLAGGRTNPKGPDADRGPV